MIQSMNKYAFLVFHSDYEGFLHQLRGLGVLHVNERKDSREVEELNELQAERTHIKETLRTLRPFITDKAVGSASSIKTQDEGKALLAKIEDELKHFAQQEEQLTALSLEAEEVRPWGAFDPSTISQLAASGYTLSFFTTPQARFTETFQSEYDVVPIAVVAGRVYFVFLHPAGTAPALPEAEYVKSPLRSIATLEQLVAEAEATRELQLQSLIERTKLWQAQLNSYDLLLENRFTFGRTRLQGDRLADEKLILLEGFVPTTEALAFEQALSATGCYFHQVDFDPETERVPIQLKNNAFTRCFEFITGLFSLPNYQEIDQTYLIAPFFMLFFGMCFGDAGYGLILFSVCTYFRLKSKDGDTSLLGLGQWLGGGAFVIGMLMGGIFGIELPWAHNKAYIFNQDNMMMISVIVGLVQILLGKAIGAYKKGRQKGWRHSLAGYAWVLLLIAVGLIYVLPKASFAIPQPVTYVLYGVAGLSVLVAFLYNSPGKNPFINFGSGLWTTYETASGLLGDSLSYIRLFAIGLTGGILGSVFNQLAMSCLPTSGSGASIFSYIIGWVLALIVLLFGHGINFGIAMIGAFVHPLRLTFVEYYKNSEFEGGGKPYTPFTRK